MIILVFPALILICAVYIWIKDWYTHSLKEAEDRKHSFAFLKRITLFLPITLQGVFLFCYALWQSFFIGNALADFVDFLLFNETNWELASLEPMKIIITGSLLITIQCFLLKATYSDSKGFNISIKLLVFIGSVLFLKFLIDNISHSVSLVTSKDVAISYNNDYILLFSLLLISVLTIVKGAWLYRRELNSLKYFALASRILVMYSLFTIATAVPRIIYTVIKYV